VDSIYKNSQSIVFDMDSGISDKSYLYKIIHFSIHSKESKTPKEGDLTSGVLGKTTH
jgi:hypothetical protein